MHFGQKLQPLRVASGVLDTLGSTVVPEKKSKNDIEANDIECFNVNGGYYLEDNFSDS